MKLLVNNTEQEQIERGRTDILLYGRSAENPDERVPVRVTGFDPYFYAPAKRVRADEQFFVSHDQIQRIEYVNDDPEPFMDKQELVKVYTTKPQHVPEVKGLFDKTWNADVAYTNRFRIDSGVKAYAEVPDSAYDESAGEYIVTPEEVNPVQPGSGDATPGVDGLETVSPRVVTLDIEVDDRGDGFPEAGERRILSIVAHDSFTDETAAFVDTNGRAEAAVADMFGGQIPESASDIHENLDKINLEPTEARMLIAFRSWFDQMDPDIVTGWNADDFDLPHIIKRMDELNQTSANVLSPMGWAGITSRGEARIKGRTIYDLLDVYKANSFTEISSYSLDDVAKEVLGEDKIEFSGSYFDLYENDLSKFLEYNTHDVVLSVGIDEEAGVISFRDTLRRQVGVDFEDSYHNKDFIEMMCRRKLNEWGMVGLTPPGWGEAPESDYDGGYVLDPYMGIAENVVGIDLSSLYPYTMAMLNSSPETKTEASANTIIAGNGIGFEREPEGLFKELVDDAIDLKTDYKEELLDADSEEGREKWERKYGSAKTITNSIYGVIGWERFFLYDEDVAEAITLTGQQVIKATANHVRENTPYEVVYGDTDSTYVKFPDGFSAEECLEEAEALCEELNDEIYPELAEDYNIAPEDSLWNIEREAYMRRFFQAGKKKRYAYLAEWKDGSWLDEPSVSISGFASQRSDTAELTEEAEREIFRHILLHGDDEIGHIIFGAAEEIRSDDPDWGRLGIPGGLGKKITDDPATAERDGYYAVSCDGDICYPQDAHPRAAYNANLVLGTNIGEGDKPMRVYTQEQTYGTDRPIDTIGFTEPADIENADVTIRLDTGRMIERLVVSPLQKICAAVDVDVNAAIRGQKQSGLGMF